MPPKGDTVQDDSANIADLAAAGDNVDAALGLEKRRHYKSGGIKSALDKQQSDLVAQRRALGIPDGHAHQVTATNAGANEAFAKRINALIENGVDPREATRMALDEQPTAVEQSGDAGSDRDTYLGASVHHLMGVDREIQHGGSRKGRKREDRRKKPAGLFRVIEDEPRDGGRVSARVSASTQKALEQVTYIDGRPMSTGDVLYALGLAIDSGRTWTEIVGSAIVKEVTTRHSPVSDTITQTPPAQTA